MEISKWTITLPMQLAPAVGMTLRTVLKTYLAIRRHRKDFSFAYADQIKGEQQTGGFVLSGVAQAGKDATTAAITELRVVLAEVFLGIITTFSVESANPSEALAERQPGTLLN